LALRGDERRSTLR